MNSFKIKSKFYIIMGDDKPIYVGYTNRTVKQRFKEHLKGKDFSDYDNVAVIELKKCEKSFNFTWNYRIIQKDADIVDITERYLIKKYGTQNSVYQKAIGGGQNWADIKHFVISNESNPKFSNMASGELKRYLQMERRLKTDINSFIYNICSQEMVDLKNLFSNMRPKKLVDLSDFIKDIYPREFTDLKGFVGRVDIRGKTDLKHFIGGIHPQKVPDLCNFVYNIRPRETEDLNNFVNRISKQEVKDLKHLISHMDSRESRDLKSLVRNIDRQEIKNLNGFINRINRQEIKDLSNLVSGLIRQESRDLNNFIKHLKGETKK